MPGQFRGRFRFRQPKPTSEHYNGRRIAHARPPNQRRDDATGAPALLHHHPARDLGGRSEGKRLTPMARLRWSAAWIRSGPCRGIALLSQLQKAVALVMRSTRSPKARKARQRILAGKLRNLSGEPVIVRGRGDSLDHKSSYLCHH